MKFAFKKIIVFSLFFTLVNLFALGCFFTSQGLMEHTMHNSSMECCGGGDSQFSDHAGYNLQYSIAYNVSGFINLLTFIVLATILFIRETRFFNYYLIKDRYGGFKLFNKLILLLKTGIIHPKVY